MNLNDTNYVYERILEFVMDENVARNRVQILDKVFKRNVWQRLSRGLGKHLLRLFRPIQKPSTDIQLNERWVLVNTTNQLKAVEFLEKYPGYRFYTTDPPHYPNSLQLNHLGTPQRLSIVWLIRRAPQYFRWWRSHRLATLRALNYLLTVPGVFERYLELFTEYQPECVIVANDHIPAYRAIVLAARKLNIPTFYIQHACVAEDFPGLITSVSLLEGQDSVDKYTQPVKQSDSKIFTIGMPKFDDAIEGWNRGTKVNRLGIAFNSLLSVQDVQLCIRRISQAFPELDIIVRAHPRESRNLEEIKKASDDISDARQESSFEFLKRIDVLVGSYSSIHLEATLMNVYPILYNGKSQAVSDTYGFIKNKLVKKADSIGEVVGLIQQLTNSRPNIRHRAKHYCSTVETSEEGASGALATTIINDYLNKHH